MAAPLDRLPMSTAKIHCMMNGRRWEMRRNDTDKRLRQAWGTYGNGTHRVFFSPKYRMGYIMQTLLWKTMEMKG